MSVYSHLNALSVINNYAYILAFAIIITIEMKFFSEKVSLNDL
jgi:hypothetical protein